MYRSTWTRILLTISIWIIKGNITSTPKFADLRWWGLCYCLLTTVFTPTGISLILAPHWGFIHESGSSEVRGFDLEESFVKKDGPTSWKFQPLTINTLQSRWGIFKIHPNGSRSPLAWYLFLGGFIHEFGYFKAPILRNPELKRWSPPIENTSLS